MYTNNQNYRYNMNDNRKNYYYSKHMDHEYNQDCSNQNINYRYNVEINNVGCQCDAQAQEGIEKMNKELIRINKVNLLPEDLTITLQLAQANANKLSANTFLPYAPDPDSFYSNFQQLRLAALKADDYYDRAVEQLIKGYECCKNAMDKNRNCWYTKQYNCEKSIERINEIKNQIAPKRSLLIQTLKSTGNLAVEVDKSEAVVLAKNTGVRLPLEYALALTNEQIHYLNESYKEKYDAYYCCKNNNPYEKNCSCEEYNQICDCKSLFRLSNESLSNAEQVGALAANQISFSNEGFVQYIDAIEKSQQASSYLYAAMKQSSGLSRDINALWKEAYDEAVKLFNCCTNESPGASCCSPNCDKFLQEANKLQHLAVIQTKESVDAEIRMNKNIDDATSIKLQELEYVKEAQTMATEIFNEYSSITNEITNYALPMMDNAYNCCGAV